MEHRRAQFRLAIQVVGLRRIYLPNGLIILFTSLSLRQMILSCCHYSHTKNIDVVNKAKEQCFHCQSPTTFYTQNAAI